MKIRTTAIAQDLGYCVGTLESIQRELARLLPSQTQARHEKAGARTYIALTSKSLDWISAAVDDALRRVAVPATPREPAEAEAIPDGTRTTKGGLER